MSKQLNDYTETRNNFIIITSPQTEKSLFKPIKYFQISKPLLNKKTKKAENKIIINEDSTNEIDYDSNLSLHLSEYDENSLSEKKQNIIIEIFSDNQNSTNSSNFKIEKNKIFQLNFKSKVGRKPKTSIIKGNHTKFSEDNILRKIKVKFNQKIINYLNSIIIFKNIKNIKRLKNLKGKISQDNTIKYNINIINSKLKDVLSSTEINGKFKLFEKYYNKNVIDTIYNENIKELIEILEMTYLDIFKIFRGSSDNGKLVGLEKLDSVIREIELKENDDEYINKFKNVVMNFENYYLNKSPRK